VRRYYLRITRCAERLSTGRLTPGLKRFSIKDAAQGVCTWESQRAKTGAAGLSPGP
jgi:hypothetical protein